MSIGTYIQALEEKYRQERLERPSVWSVSPGLSRKVTEDGRMQPFFGATTVLKLREEEKALCRRVQEQLLDRLDAPLVAIDPGTFHLTIHALSNPYSVPGGTDPEIAADIERRREGVTDLFRDIRESYGEEQIRVRSLGASTNGKDVISLKFVPSDERSRAVLTDLFGRFEQFYPLHKPYVPHISLAYFLPRVYDSRQITALYDRLDQLEADGITQFEVTIDILDLAYQHHAHMNDFRDQFTVRDC